MNTRLNNAPLSSELLVYSVETATEPAEDCVTVALAMPCVPVTVISIQIGEVYNAQTGMPAC